MRYLPGARQMKAADQYTINVLGVPSLELMERAAAACVRTLKEQLEGFPKIGVVCGSGNNGGDGFAIARMLKRDGYEVTAILAGNLERCTKECEKQLRLFEEAGGIVGNEFAEEEYSVIVDALFGVGLSRDIEGRYLSLLETMNRAEAFKFAVDIPSGVSADTGHILGAAFFADLTVTFQEKKFGMAVYPGKELAGNVVIADIGISEQMFKEDGTAVIEYERAEYKSLLPPRKDDSHKGTYGKVLVIAGSKGMCGAAYFNAKAAYMSGAGLVKIYTAEENRAVLQQLLPEAIIVSYERFDEEELKRHLLWADVVCAGSGIGMGEIARRHMETVLLHGNCPCVIDADGLNIMSGDEELSGLLTEGRYVLTPHMKEMSRLTGRSVADIKNDRLKVLKDYAEKTGAVCVLKDSRTLIGKEGERTVLNPSGNSAMAKAGSGDILAGIIAGFLAQDLGCFDGAVLGAYIHGRAGDCARGEKGNYSVMAEDIISQIGTAINECAG